MYHFGSGIDDVDTAGARIFLVRNTLGEREKNVLAKRLSRPINLANLFSKKHMSASNVLSFNKANPPYPCSRTAPQSTGIGEVNMHQLGARMLSPDSH